MDVYEQWGQTVQDAVKRFAKSQPTDVREDFEQECYIKLMGITVKVDKIFTEQGPDQARKYVYAACHNHILDLIRSRNGYEAVMQPNGLIPADELYSVSEPKKFMGLKESDVDDAIKTLPRDQQHVVRSMFFQDKTEREVAAQLNTSQPQINRIKQKAFESLKKLLKES